MNNFEIKRKYVALLVEDKEEETYGGLIVVMSKTSDETPISKVTAVGTDVTEIKVGDKVMHYPNIGHMIKHEGQNYLLIPEADIIAVVGE